MSFNRKAPAYLAWVTNPNVDQDYKDELHNASDEELLANFGTELEFGTAGIRGIMGAGPGRFNDFTIKKVTLALAQFLKQKPNIDLKQGVVIGHDNRYNSQKFSQLVADILSAEDIPSYLFPNNAMEPTPLISFATKKLQAVAGVVITASHNPAIYNGYKIYNSEGCQLSESETDQIAKNMANLPDIMHWKFTPKPELIKIVPENIINDYDEMLDQLQFYPDETASKQDLKIVYSAVNGTGSAFTPRLLRKYGYTVIEVPEHSYEDPSFKNVGNPNPEFAPAWTLPLALAKKEQADLVIMNDPDADRIGIAVPNDCGDWIRLNGNETGPLLIDWKLSELAKAGLLPTNPALYSSFVTSDLGDRIAAETYGAKIIKTLTGFKWMGGEIAKEPERNLNFVFAYEESFGYVIDDSTRDKDGIQAAIMVSELAWMAKTKFHKSLLDVLDDIYRKYGYYTTDTLNYNVKPEEKAEKLDPIMVNLRKHPPHELCGLKVVKVEDYLQGLFNMPSQNLMKFYLEDKSWIAVRPSGTEPKLKVYFVIVGDSPEDTKQKAECISNAFKTKMQIKI
ncbi:phosphoglucomutase [Entomoplasma freundtii]|uniref:Phosphoglucomutase/phosphomannomutase n=1 Tax=Entomoplasma freundtii TaxID=74700 RepID=A0A2K8NV46_9MOLU|nr:phospho-sugar mutase [Entomoplasma freundtii]ATZ16503.1 phosphoglucomutase/phosphomannomutase [Entomoplasma freundtii]TDY56033.1 phosphoglucomutase [Entomoplasma freundtii]